MAGESLAQARWDLLDPSKYLFATVQTIAGCPENCSFCSVWVTDGRRPRRRLASKIIEEVNQLAGIGYKYIAFADDNFNPATRSRIKREPSAARRREFEHAEGRLQFFAEYDRSVPAHVRSITRRRPTRPSSTTRNTSAILPPGPHPCRAHWSRVVQS